MKEFEQCNVKQIQGGKYIIRQSLVNARQIMGENLRQNRTWINAKQIKKEIKGVTEIGKMQVRCYSRGKTKSFFKT